MSLCSIRSFVLPLCLVLVSTFAASCGSDDSADTSANTDPPIQANAVPADRCDTSGWVVVDVGEFAFSTPADLVDQEIQGIDSLVGEYSRPGMAVNFDYGWYSSDFDYLVEVGGESMPVTIDDLDGVIVSADLTTVPSHEGNLFIGLYVPEVEAIEESATALSMWIDYDDESDTAEATCVLESVTFA